MAVLVGIAILAAVIFWMNRGGSRPGPISGRGGRPQAQKRCSWVQVDPDTERRLKEYRCSVCGTTAYGRGEALPAPRICRVQ